MYKRAVASRDSEYRAEHTDNNKLSESFIDCCVLMDVRRAASHTNIVPMPMCIVHTTIWPGLIHFILL